MMENFVCNMKKTEKCDLQIFVLENDWFSTTKINILLLDTILKPAYNYDLILIMTLYFLKETIFFYLE